MARQTSTGAVVYLGVGGHVAALDLATGQEIWRRKVKSSQLLCVTLFEGRLLATANGEIWCLDRDTGTVLWHNKLKGLGMGFVTVAGGELTPAMAAALVAQQQAAAAAAVAASASTAAHG
jgi:outer membrane protein assembly factor BamB